MQIEPGQRIRHQETGRTGTIESVTEYSIKMKMDIPRENNNPFFIFTLPDVWDMNLSIETEFLKEYEII